MTSYQDPQRMHALFYKLPSNVAQCFWKYSLIFHLSAIGLTYILVTSGFDWLYFTYTRSVTLLWLFFPALIIGYIVPFLLPLGMYISGKGKKDVRKLNAVLAIGQAAIISLLIFTFYKIVTGRPAPELFHTIAAVDTSREFNFGFLHGGVISGWPSGHTVWAFTMATVLLTLYPKSKKIRYFSMAYALYIGLGMSVTFHWFSDFVAGAIIGIVIGNVVGKCFSNRYSKAQELLI